MLPMDQIIYNHPYLFHILGPSVLFWIIWIPFGKRLIQAAEKLTEYVKDS
ncbi:hypothetical protein [Anaerotignum sp.]|nr:hypothetical protein [Anaerotignum sp.]